jgi:apolipoprotein N-acyltransferase
VQADPFPRDTRWVRQSRAPLPPLEAFDASPEEELHGQPPAELAPVQRGFTAPILFGGLTWAEAPADAPPGSPRRVLYNTALLLGADGRVLGSYDKVHLLAFGEYLPFGELFPELYDALPQAGRFTPGEAAGVIPFRGHRLGLMICYEDILASFTADLARERPNIILNVTNDAWFGRTSEPHLHLALAVFRAVENRLVLVRSTNTGVSAVIEPTGLLRAQTRIDDPETLVADVAMLEGGTPYSATGHAFAWLLVAALLWRPARALWARRRATPES